MLKTTIQEALNNQINGEMASTYLDLSMAAYFESKNLQGLANWMEVQAGEEWGHAMKIYHHVNERGGRVILKQIDALHPNGSRHWTSSSTHSLTS